MSLSVYGNALKSAVLKPKATSIPERTLTRSVTVKADEVAQFCRVVHAPVTNTVPAPYLHTLGFMPSLELMTARDFPLPVLGMVHVYNTFTQHRPVSVGETVDLEVSISAPRNRDQGIEIDVQVNAAVAGQPAFSEASTYFAKKARLQGVTEQAQPKRLTAPQTAEVAQWRFESGIGEAYARVSGDYNVIHLNSLAAKAFGFPRAIAHGMYTASRAFFASKVQADSFTWEVQFAKPIVLPAKAGVRVERSAENSEVTVAVVRPKDGAPHVISHITSA